MSDSTKVCRRCTRDLSTSSFSPAKRNRDGLASWCRECLRDYRKTPEYRAKARARRAKQVAADPAKAKTAQKKWRDKAGSAYHKKWRDEHPRENWGMRLKRVYGLTLEEWDEMVLRHQGRCGICNRPTPVLHVDHDHSCCSGKRGACGKCVRGLLCFGCNSGIGSLRDDPALLRAALVYLTGQAA